MKNIGIVVLSLLLFFFIIVIIPIYSFFGLLSILCGADGSTVMIWIEKRALHGIYIFLISLLFIHYYCIYDLME